MIELDPPCSDTSISKLFCKLSATMYDWHSWFQAVNFSQRSLRMIISDTDEFTIGKGCVENLFILLNLSR